MQVLSSYLLQVAGLHSYQLTCAHEKLNPVRRTESFNGRSGTFQQDPIRMEHCLSAQIPACSPVVGPIFSMSFSEGI